MTTPLAPKAMYSDCDRAERKRIAKAFSYAKKAERAAQGLLRIPNHLYACAGCHRSVSRCICTDADGKPLDWGTGAMA